MQSNMLETLIRRFPERSLIIRSGSDTTYVVLKTWHQLCLVGIACFLSVWTVVASVGFSVNYQSLVSVRSVLEVTIVKNDAFIAQLESDQKNAYELRQQFQAEVDRRRVAEAQIQGVREVAAASVADTAPSENAAFVNWFADALADRIDAVDAENRDLSELIMNLSNSVAKISGHRPPAVLDEVRPWFANVAGDLTEAYRKQSESMQTLHTVMAQMLERNYATIERTPLASSSIAALPPSYGAGGPAGIEMGSDHVFQLFDDRASDLLRLSQDWQQVQQLLDCAPLIAPVDYYNLTSKFGDRKDPFTNRPGWHNGVDLGAWPGTKVRATAPGVVRHAGNKGGYGRLVVVDHGCGIQTLYAHLKSISVKKGQQVSYRDVVGAVGSSGRSTGPHVHYEIRIHDEAVDPYEFIEAGRYVFKEQELTIADAQ
jgi:murein DD-endopeptidase MepM/ murein hydrolase activator NlpD